MKHLPLILKIVAILGAAFAVYAWMDTKGQIKDSMAHMTSLSGDNIVSKSSTIPQHLKDKETFKKNWDAESAKSKNLEGKIAEMNSDLEAERSKSIQINNELQKKNAELRTANLSIESGKKKIAEDASTIEALKQEIINTKSLLAQTNEADELKKKVSTLEADLADKEKLLADATEKLKILEASEIVEVIEVDPTTGKQVKRKVVKTPYIPNGDIATILRVDLPTEKANILAFNRGSKDNLEVGQKLVLKREGEKVAEVVVDTVYEDYSIAIADMKVGIPETIEVGDLLELAQVAKHASNGVAPVKEADGSAEGAAETSTEAPAPEAPAAEEAPASM